MTRMRRDVIQAIAVAATCAVLLASTAQAATTAQQKCQQAKLWSATALAGTPTDACDLKFGSSGAVYSYSKTAVDWVRAVRSGC